ncbi:MAG: lycopene cyclase domain-containing protein [Dermatophilaceae bacterium]
MARFAYAGMLALVLATTLPLQRVFALRVLTAPRRIARAVLPVAVAFLGWDVLAARAGIWSFDPAQVLGWQLLGLPLEEWAFFLVVPLAGLLTYEAVGVVLGGRAAGGPADASTGQAGLPGAP